MLVKRLLVLGSSHSISAYDGEDVTLNCSVDSHITPEHIEELSWKKTDGDEDILVMLYQNNEAFPDSSDEQYRDRVEFFTDEIPKGNFSIRLKSVRTEDKGVYMCQVFAGDLSANATVVLEQLGLTVRGPSAPLVAPLGSSVVLSCYVDEPLPVQSLEVKWRRTDSDADSETVVHLFLDGESRPKTQHQDYRDRAHFFTDQIQHGNFSLRLDNLRAEDEGKYTCKVYSQQDSGETEVQIKDVERLLVSGSSRSIFAYDGADVTLNCSVDSHITPEHIEELSWKKTDRDENIPVLLYQNNETFPGSSDGQYRDRVEFFTDEIPKGNFSLRLKSVRTEDKGVYMCQVFAGGLSANATVVLEQLGFSSLHIMVLFFCISAASGAVFLLCCLIYCRSKDTVSSSTIWNLQLSLVFISNICMSIAFIFWGLTEGSLHETITCCALYILRPVMLIWALPYLKYLQDNIKTWTRFFKITSEFAVFTIFFYSVLFEYVWRKTAHDTSIIRRVISGIGFGGVVLSCLFLSTVILRLPSQKQQRGGFLTPQT
ncbi:butyrophilin-like protein 2 [Pseudorasbora parva]|uniref:butyrophilin-like protein 2 n=1 Tax=Pseudorasbora parva TaxID=51549 RepID=UPI00351ED85D